MDTQTTDSWESTNFTAAKSDRYKGYDDLISVERALDNYVIPTLCVLGMIGNFVNLLVLTRSGYSQIEAAGERAVQSGLIALSVSDFLFCLIMFPRAFVGSTQSLFPSRGFKLFYQSHGSWVVTSLILTSTWITVTLATLRYLGICHPLRCRRLIGVVPERIAYLAVTLACWCVNLPAFWQYRVTDMPFQDNRTFYLVDIGPLDYTMPSGIAFQCLRGVAGMLVPTAVLVYCNSALVRALRRSHKIRQHFQVNGRVVSSRYLVTVTLAAISVAFIVLVLPSEIMDFVFHFVEANEARTEVFILIRSLANTLQVLNFSGNVVLYCSVNSRFRKALLLMLSRKRRQNSARTARTQSYFRFQGSSSRSAGSGITSLCTGNRAASNRNECVAYPVAHFPLLGSMNLTEYRPPSLKPCTITSEVLTGDLLEQGHDLDD